MSRDQAGLRAVLVTTDETTQHALDRSAPVDAYVVGIVDAPPQLGK